MRLSLAICSALFFGSYVTAVPVPVFPDGEASGSGNQHPVAPAQQPATYYPLLNHPPLDRTRPDLTQGPNHQPQNHQPPDNHPVNHLPVNHQPADHQPAAHHNPQVGGLPAEQPPSGQHTPGPIRHEPSTRAHRNDGSPYARTGHPGPSGSGGGGSGGTGRVPCTVAGCDRTFSRASDVDRHINTVHSGNQGNRITCPHDNCDTSFSRPDALQRHIRQQHPSGGN